MHPPETASSPAPLRFLFPPPLMVMTFLTETSSWGGGGVDEEEEDEEGRWRTFTACFSTSCWKRTCFVLRSIKKTAFGIEPASFSPS